MDKLRRSGEKFTKEDVVMITKTKKNELVWLEKGNDIKGLKHIIDGHEGILKINLAYLKKILLVQ